MLGQERTKATAEERLAEYEGKCKKLIDLVRTEKVFWSKKIFDLEAIITNQHGTIQELSLQVESWKDVAIREENRSKDLALKLQQMKQSFDMEIEEEKNRTANANQNSRLYKQKLIAVLDLLRLKRQQYEERWKKSEIEAQRERMKVQLLQQKISELESKIKKIQSNKINNDPSQSPPIPPTVPTTKNSMLNNLPKLDTKISREIDYGNSENLTPRTKPRSHTISTATAIYKQAIAIDAPNLSDINAQVTREIEPTPLNNTKSPSVKKSHMTTPPSVNKEFPRSNIKRTGTSDQNQKGRSRFASDMSSCNNKKSPVDGGFYGLEIGKRRKPQQKEKHFMDLNEIISAKISKLKKPSKKPQLTQSLPPKNNKGRIYSSLGEQKVLKNELLIPNHLTADVGVGPEPNDGIQNTSKSKNSLTDWDYLDTLIEEVGR